MGAKKLTATGISSISGSASSSSSGSDSGSAAPTDKVTKLLKRQNLNPGTAEGRNDDEVDSDEEAELAHNRRRAMLRTAIIWFTPTKVIPELGIPEETQFGMHRFLFPPLDNVQDYLGELKRMQISNPAAAVLDEHGEEEERRITLLMVAGGHFAGAVIGLKPKGKNEKQDLKGAGEVRIIKSKTFHRYTSTSPIPVGCPRYLPLTCPSTKEARRFTRAQRQFQVKSNIGRCHAATLR